MNENDEQKNPLHLREIDPRLGAKAIQMNSPRGWLDGVIAFDEGLNLIRFGLADRMGLATVKPETLLRALVELGVDLEQYIGRTEYTPRAVVPEDAGVILASVNGSSPETLVVDHVGDWKRVSDDRDRGTTLNPSWVMKHEVEHTLSDVQVLMLKRHMASA